MPALSTSLLKIPGLTIDQLGNVNFPGEILGKGLRPRHDFVMALPNTSLKDVMLGDLLDWLRWGSGNTVMWECTLPELKTLIEKWEDSNPDPPPERYTTFRSQAQSTTSWVEFWTKYSASQYAYRRRKCPEHNIQLREYNDCPKCYKPWYDLDKVYGNRRGEWQYNLVAKADGHFVARLVAQTPRQERIGSPLSSPDQLF